MQIEVRLWRQRGNVSESGSANLTKEVPRTARIEFEAPPTVGLRFDHESERFVVDSMVSFAGKVSLIHAHEVGSPV